MKPEHIKKLLLSAVRSVSDNAGSYCYNPQKDFSRTRKLSFETVINAIIGMGGGSLTNELVDIFKASPDMPSASAFVQQRGKIKPEALKDVFKGFTEKILKEPPTDLTLLAVDGSDIRIPPDPDDEETYFPGTNGQKGYGLLHLNALYDLRRHIYTDVLIQGRMFSNEHTALQEMVDRSSIGKAVVTSDRGYESYNNMAHIQEKGWFFLIRVKDGRGGIKENLDLPGVDEFDVDISLKLTRRQTKETKELFKDRNHYRFIPSTVNFDYLPLKSGKHDPVKFYDLNFRVVRFKITGDTFETVLTNLDAQAYPPEKLKELYAARWGIETSFRDLKYTVGMLSFHSKKVACVRQEIYARLTMYNFAEMITSHVVIEKKQRKYIYKANFSVAAHMCRLFYHGMTAPPDLEAIIARNIIPVRTERHRERHLRAKAFHGFLYRIA